MRKIPVLNTYVSDVNMQEATEKIEKMIVSNTKSYVVAVNVDVIMKIENDRYLKRIIDEADMTLVDGQPLIWITRFYKRPVKAKISGSDLVPVLCEKAAEKGYSMFLIGGKEGVAEQAKGNLEKKYKGINIAGIYSPPIGFEYNGDELVEINTLISKAKPDILIVCFGCPKQEKWIYENINKYDAKVSICAGATIDFLSGNIKRAPRWMSNNGLEWFYRFLKEPKRMFKRYFLDDMKIFRLVLKYRKENRI